MRDPIPPEALLAALPPPMAAVAERLRTIVRAAVPDAIEAVRTGWRVIGYDAPAGSASASRRPGASRRSGAPARSVARAPYFAWIMVEPVHVHLGFVYGVAMDDPAGDLGGDAKLARWLTFRVGDAVDLDRLVPLVREARRVALLSRAERAARALDADVSPGSAVGHE